MKIFNTNLQLVLTFVGSRGAFIAMFIIVSNEICLVSVMCVTDLRL